MRYNQSQNSSFWLGEGFFDNDRYDMLGEEIEAKPKGKDPMKLAGYRRAIGNFVRIVTGEPIPVRFNVSGDSYTDGKTVVISASLKDKDFDSAVGLALHEGSHIKLTDFNTLKTLEDFLKKDDEYMIELAEKHGAVESRLSEDDKAFDRWWSTGYVMPKMKDLINIIEDRRIDRWVYSNAPGYRGYYEALYDKYFNAKIIDKGLKSDEYTDASWESFLFRICNITNPNRRLDVLGLRTIWKMLDLKNIARLKTTNDVRELAYKIFKFVESQIPSLELNKPKEEPVKDQSKMTDEEIVSDNKLQKKGKAKDGNGEHGNVNDDGSIAEGEEAKKGQGGQQGNNQAPKGLDELNDRQKDQLRKAIEKQEKFLKDDVKKTGISKKMSKTMNALENSGTEVKQVEYERNNSWYSEGGKRKIDVTVINNFTKDLVNNVDCGMWDSWGLDYRKEWVNEGIRRGVVLGKKLKVRAEEKSTKFNRLRSGKIDKRMIANAGWGAEGIFQKIESFAYNPGLIHISIDNSGSMGGDRFEKAVTTSIAIAKACSMIENMDCVISFRAGSYFAGVEAPVVLVAYDSRKHGMNQIKTMLPYCCTAGITPEGLAFDAIMKEIVSSAKSKDAYFVNMSDGMPYYNDYGGEAAHKHTREQVKKMKLEGIKVISYFITGSYISDSEREAFTAMYGKEAQFIDTNKINEVAKSMNNKFLEVAQ